jgi:hypothetical protein
MCVPVYPGDFGKFAARWIERWTGHFSLYLAAFSARVCALVNQSNSVDVDARCAFLAPSREVAAARGDLRMRLALRRFGARLPRAVSATFPARLPTSSVRRSIPAKTGNTTRGKCIPNLDAYRVATCWARQRSELVGGRRDFIERERIGWPTLARAVSLPSVARQDQALSLPWRQTPGCPWPRVAVSVLPEASSAGTSTADPLGSRLGFRWPSLRLSDRTFPSIGRRSREWYRSAATGDVMIRSLRHFGHISINNHWSSRTPGFFNFSRFGSFA